MQEVAVKFVSLVAGLSSLRAAYEYGTCVFASVMLAPELAGVVQVSLCITAITELVHSLDQPES